ncbi:hypothetical protein RM572_27940 [Streptomyces sp. DSM 42041]|uniref:Uncharacterized protein n=1 Tax=Streptomyces hazeniae TaxID=3075538 RepID=A0ABU2P018_9ACTN|nr:hypothetical protein [Streptomyces sp. DSM 42041]MDT0382590.1 hypothetical protein [Streptomyces sp. DSM 42041]
MRSPRISRRRWLAILGEGNDALDAGEASIQQLGGCRTVHDRVAGTIWNAQLASLRPGTSLCGRLTELSPKRQGSSTSLPRSGGFYLGGKTL